jgi:ATP phosphoribosyltransferase regulatory subunit
VISHEPLKTNDATNQLLKSNRCTKIEWIDWYQSRISF